MFDVERLQARLPVEGWGQAFEYYDSLPSTNDQARLMAESGAPHGALVVADEQTAGRGRGENTWFTPPNAALAVSLIIRPGDQEQEYMGALSALGALAVVEALLPLGLEAQIKWPNDVLLDGRKVSGVLAEANWQADRLEYAILGIGVNVRPQSVPPQDQVQWPATCLESAAGQKIDRPDLLVGILEGTAKWYPRLGKPDLSAALERFLAYKGEEVRLQKDQRTIRGRVSGLDSYGRLVLTTGPGRERIASAAWQFNRVDRAEN
jgi:BirA family biotin operon repressor/biotin-[acetyl-CoA-carboxylase] ligase